ncbi:MAG: uroporphyrinogen decarboxylase family protein [Armatimonadota bacterium]|nr:uroporphyrinogen decarboxylase family protein [Armatimonadota bacterium]
MALISPSMADDIERRKENVRRVWDYRRVDHIPIMLQVASNPWGYTTRERFLDADKQFQIEIKGVKRSLELVPDDYIPSMRVDVGCVVIESALGAQIVFSDNPNQTCTVKEPILKSADDIYRLTMPNPCTDGLVPEGLRRIKSFVERTEGQVYVSGLDMGGSMNVAFTLLGSSEFYMLSYDAPEALHHLADFIADVFILLAEACIEAAGGIDRVTTTDFPYWWQPEKYKGHMSDDICAQYSPDFFNRFSKPYNNKIYKRFGGGMMHNCGPNPCAGEYLSHEPRIRAVDLAYDYSKNDLDAFKKAFAREGLIYFGFGGPDFGLADYRQVMEVLAPDVICVPCVTCGPDDDVKGIYGAYLEISCEYARRMNWKSD